MCRARRLGAPFCRGRRAAIIFSSPQTQTSHRGGNGPMRTSAPTKYALHVGPGLAPAALEGENPMSKGATTRRTVRLPSQRELSSEARLRVFFFPAGENPPSFASQMPPPFAKGGLRGKENIYHESDKKTEGGRRAVEYHGRPPGGLSPATGQMIGASLTAKSCGRS